MEEVLVFDSPLTSPNRPVATRAGSPQDLAYPTLGDNVDEDLDQVRQTLQNIGHTPLFRGDPEGQEALNKKDLAEEAEVVKGHVVGLPHCDSDGDADEDAEAIMVDFDQEDAEDSATAMDNLRSVQCPFNKGDIVFWFCQLEDQLTLIGVKKQWTKKIALVRFLPTEIQNEVKSLLKLQQTAAGTDIYYKIKQRLLKLYGPNLKTPTYVPRAGC